MKKILIIGGYGAVGSIITRHLAKLFPHQIIVAGRSIQKAQQFAATLDHTIIPHELDLSNLASTDIFNDTGMVIMCIDDQFVRVANLCADLGIHYIDITANQNIISKIEQLHSKAILNKSSMLLSVGLAPGITNLLAQHCTEKLKEVQAVDISILLGLGEQHGEHAYKWTFDNIHSSYSLKNGDQTTLVKSFTQQKTTELIGKRRFYLFNFSDQHTLSKTTSIQKVTTRMAFDSRFLTQSIGLLRKTGITKIFTRDKIQHFMIALFRKRMIGSDVFAVKAEAVNAFNEKYACSVKGYGEGKMTAFFAVQTALLMLQQSAPSGVHHSHRFIQNIPGFLTTLQTFDEKIQIEL
jgi:saccharopine dehydrogenase (NAD+, L-lysine-forming)